MKNRHSFSKCCKEIDNKLNVQGLRIYFDSIPINLQICPRSIEWIVDKIILKITVNRDVTGTSSSCSSLDTAASVGPEVVAAGYRTVRVAPRIVQGRFHTEISVKVMAVL